MPILYLKDLVPIFISAFSFAFLATAHRVLVPNKYSSFLQYKQEENPIRTAQSTSIRIIYLILGTIFLYNGCKFSEIQIVLGVFVSSFLNVWVAIIQYRLLKLKKTKEECFLLIGYICFVVASVTVCEITVRLLLPILKGNNELFWLDNQTISLLGTFLMIAVPIPIEAILAKCSSIVIVQTVDTFVEEVYILEKQLNMKCMLIENNKYIIDDVAAENDIDVDLLKAILHLEIIYRNRLYYQAIEWIMCRCLKNIAIRNDISVGIAQIKVSTAQKILRQNPKDFIQKLLNDKFNIMVCGKYLHILIEEYKYKHRRDEGDIQNYIDIFDYIACSYLGGNSLAKVKTVLIYSAVLRSVLYNSPLTYTGSENREGYFIKLNGNELPSELVDKVISIGELKKESLSGDKVKEIEVYCKTYYSVGLIRDIAKSYDINGIEINYDKKAV